MEPKNESEPIPTGRTSPDGSKVPFYYCPCTGQHFNSYSDLMRHVNYVKKAKLGLYALGTKSLKRKSTENDTPLVPEPRKTSAILTLPKDSIYYNSSSDDSSSDSSDSTTESITSKKDPYYAESVGSVSVESIASNKDADYAEAESVGGVSVDSECSDARS